MKRALVLILLIALVTRLVWLDARPMDHDESVHAWIALRSVVENQYYEYNPAFHGPFLYFATALSFYAFGDSDFTARLPTAVFSVIGVVTAFALRRWLGYSAYLFAFFMLFSPSILYYSRYARNDIIVLSSFLVALYFYLRYSESKKERFIYPASLFLAIIFTAKENWVEYLPIFILSIIIFKIYKRCLHDFRPSLKTVRILIICILIFIGFSSFLYSSAFMYMYGGDKTPLEAILDKKWIDHFFNVSISYWISHAVSFGGESKPHFHPVWFFLPMLLKYDFLPLAMAIASVPYFWKNRKNLSFIEVFSAVWLILAVLFYHIMSYKTPWLVVHIVAPLSLFGSIYVGRELFNLDKEALRFAFIFAAIATLVVSFHITYINYNDARNEELIYVQTQPGAVEIAETIKDLISEGRKVAVYVPGHHYWPLPWMLRHESVTFTAGGCPIGYDYVFTTMKEECEKKGYVPLKSYEFRVGFYFWKMAKGK